MKRTGFDFFHQGEQRSRKPLFFRLGEVTGCLGGIDVASVKQFLSRLGTEPGERSIDCLCRIHSSCEKSFCLIGSESQRIFLVHGIRDEIGAAGQYLSHGTHGGWHMLDTVHNGMRLVGQYDIAVFAHKLNDEMFPAEIPHLVQMFQTNINDPFQAGLSDAEDFSVSCVLSKQHTEIRRGHGIGLIGSCKINEGKAGAGRKQETIRILLIFKGEDQLIILRLRDLGQAASRKRLVHFMYNI